MAGIIEEQHPDRARLFMQWKQTPWPVLVDSLDLLGVSAVPITLAVDEYGVIRMVNPAPGEIEEKFINRTFERPVSLPEVANRAPDLDALKQATESNTVASWADYANAVVEWGGPQRTSEAIQAYQRALASTPRPAPCISAWVRRIANATIRTSANQKTSRKRLSNGARLWRSIRTNTFGAVAFSNTVRGSTSLILSTTG